MTIEEEIARPFTQQEYDAAVAEVSEELSAAKEEIKLLREALGENKITRLKIIGSDGKGAEYLGGLPLSCRTMAIR